MKELQLSKETYKITDQDGNILIEASVPDLYYTIAFCMEEGRTPTRMDFQNAADQLNREYSTNLTWSEVIILFNSLTEEMESLKKNTSSTQE